MGHLRSSTLSTFPVLHRSRRCGNLRFGGLEWRLSLKVQHASGVCNHERANVTIPRLPRVKLPKYIYRYWGRDPFEYVEIAASSLMPGARALPLTRWSGAAVYPVIGPGATGNGNGNGNGLLNVAFISASPLSRAASDLSVVRSYGPAAVLVPQSVQPTYLDVAEFDLRSLGVIQMDRNLTVAELLASPERVSPRAFSPWTELRDLQLRQFDCAHTPTRDGSLAIQPPRKSGGFQGMPVSSATWRM